MERILIGSITMNNSVSNKEALSWLEEWVLNSSIGMNSFYTMVDVIFSYERDIYDSMRYIMGGESGWKLSAINEFFCPNGVTVRFVYDHNAEKLLKELKQQK